VEVVVRGRGLQQCYSDYSCSATATASHRPVCRNLLVLLMPVVVVVAVYLVVVTLSATKLVFVAGTEVCVCSAICAQPNTVHVHRATKRPSPRGYLISIRKCKLVSPSPTMFLVWSVAAVACSSTCSL
jgi:hypothetical protein